MTCPLCTNSTSAAFARLVFLKHDHSGLIPSALLPSLSHGQHHLIKRGAFKKTCRQSGSLPQKNPHFSESPASHLSFGLSTKALRYVVYRDCTARLLAASRVASVELHSHRCAGSTSTRSFCQKHLFIAGPSKHSWSTSPHIQRPDHQHQGSLLPVGSTAPTQLV